MNEIFINNKFITSKTKVKKSSELHHEAWIDGGKRKASIKHGLFEKGKITDKGKHMFEKYDPAVKFQYCP